MRERNPVLLGRCGTIGLAVSLCCILCYSGGLQGQNLSTDAYRKSEYHYDQGQRYAKRGDYKSAEKEYKKALKINKK